MQINWTGQRSAGALLYQAYTNQANVVNDEGRWVGQVLKTDKGFDCRSDGVQLGVFADEATALEAFKVLAESGRDWNVFTEWANKLK